MNNYCRIQCFGSHKVPIKNWIVDSSTSINRLIYVLGGNGGYIKNGEKIPFVKGHLYLLPGFADIVMYTSYDPPENRLDHTFLNFELLPPIISKDVLELAPNTSPEAKSALDAFHAICIKSQNRLNVLLDKADVEYLRSTVIYLSELLIKNSNARLLDDCVVLKALEIMHTNLSKAPTVSQMAKSCSMSVDGFIRRFTQNLGETPYSYLKKLKVSAAIEYKRRGLFLEEIAEKCGYADASTLLHAISSTQKKEPTFR